MNLSKILDKPIFKLSINNTPFNRTKVIHYLSDFNSKVLINNMKRLDPEGEFMSCFGSTDPVTGKHKERLTTPNTVLFMSPASHSDSS